MKKLFFFSVIFLLMTNLSRAQCVIYACDNTGSWGAGYNNDNAPTSEKECTDVAVKLCKEKGGTACTFLYKSNKAGWWGFINGKKANAANFFQGGDGYQSKTEAETSVRSKYRSSGGMDADNIKVYTWYVYSNPK